MTKWNRLTYYCKGVYSLAVLAVLLSALDTEKTGVFCNDVPQAPRAVVETGGSTNTNAPKGIGKNDGKIEPSPKIPGTASSESKNSNLNDTAGSTNKCQNGTESCKEESNENNGGFGTFKAITDNSGMLFRAMYVLLAVTGIVVVYFVVRALRLRRKRSKSRKYGIITQHDDGGGLEMEPLGDGDDDDDDYTVFEMNERKK